MQQNPSVVNPPSLRQVRSETRVDAPPVPLVPVALVAAWTRFRRPLSRLVNNHTGQPPDSRFEDPLFEDPVNVKAAARFLGVSPSLECLG